MMTRMIRWSSLAVALVALGVACGSDGDEPSPVDSEGTEETPASTAAAGVDPTTGAAASDGTRLSGTFSATPGQGYTVEIHYDVTVTDVLVELASAPPGEAYLLPQVATDGGSLTVENTTEGRETAFTVQANPRLGLLYNATEAEPWVTGPMRCEFEFGGERYCFGPDIAFDQSAAGIDSPAGGLSLDPDGRAVLPAINGESNGSVGKSVNEMTADQFAERIVSEPPDLVWVGWDSTLLEACEFFGGPIAILSGDGAVLAEAGDVPRGFGQGPPCEDIPA